MAIYKGGYQIIDFTGKEIDTTGITIPGVYAAIEGATKPILAANVYAPDGFGELVLNFYVNLALESSDFVILQNASYKITVNDDDLVKLVAIE